MPKHTGTRCRQHNVVDREITTVCTLFSIHVWCKIQETQTGYKIKKQGYSMPTQCKVQGTGYRIHATVHLTSREAPLF
jgi:hypothetical protein